MDAVMVMAAQGGEVLEIGWALVGPMHDVVDVGELRILATGESTSPIATLRFPTLGAGGESTGTALEHGVAEGVIESERDRGIATDAADGLGAQEPKMLDLGRPRAPTQQREVGMRHDEEALRRDHHIAVARRVDELTAWATTIPTATNVGCVAISTAPCPRRRSRRRSRTRTRTRSRTRTGTRPSVTTSRPAQIESARHTGAGRKEFRRPMGSPWHHR